MMFKKIGEIAKKIKEYEPESKKSVEKVLLTAEKLEKESEEFYKKSAKKEREKELKEFFEFMANEEKEHLEKIRELKKEINGNNKSKKIKKVENNKKIDIKKIPAGKTTISAIMYALWREKKAIEFYEGIAKKSKGKVKSFFKELAEFEREHERMLEEYVDNTVNAEELIMG